VPAPAPPLPAACAPARPPARSRRSGQGSPWPGTPRGTSASPPDRPTAGAPARRESVGVWYTRESGAVNRSGQGRRPNPPGLARSVAML
jgi:hypothetical protein